MAEQQPWRAAVASIREACGLTKGWPYLEATIWCIVKSNISEAFATTVRVTGEQPSPAVGALLSAAIEEQAGKLTCTSNYEKLKRVATIIKKHQTALLIIADFPGDSAPPVGEVIRRLPTAPALDDTNAPTTVTEYLNYHAKREDATKLITLDFLILAYQESGATMRYSTRDAQRAREWLQRLQPTDAAFKKVGQRQRGGGEHAKLRALQVRTRHSPARAPSPLPFH